MKKIVFLTMICFFAFVFVSCGDSDPEIEYPDEDQQDEEPAADSDSADTDADTGDTDTADTGDTDADTGDTDTSDTGDTDTADTGDTDSEAPADTEWQPSADAIGTFSVTFNGPLNTTISMQSRGGQGPANFTLDGQQFSYSSIKVIGIDLFPLAMVNSGNIIILWLNELTASDVLGSSEKQVFGVAFPQGAAVGSGNMADMNAYSFFGDITIDIKAGGFNINCVRAVGNTGILNMTANDGSNIALTADGDLYDPSLAGGMIPYPACQ